MSEKLDEKLFPRLREATGHVDEAVWLSGHTRISHEERDQFINNEIENPRFTYRRGSKANLIPEKIEEFQSYIRESDVHSVVADLYERKLGRELVRNALIDSSLNGQDENFFKLSSDLYGKPKKKYFSYVASQLKILCADHQETCPEQTKRLLKVVSKISTDEVDIDVSVLPPPNNSGVLIESVDQVEKIFSETLKRLKIDDWSIQTDDTSARTTFAVEVARKNIYIPGHNQLLTRKPGLTDLKIKALAEHEIGVHVRRVKEASDGPLKLLQVGFDSYLPGEEGLAGYVQQQVEGAEEFYGFDRYLAACLAVGIDGTPRDFRAVFSLMTDYYTIKFKEEEGAFQAPFQAAWAVCVRIFRGTTGQTSGCIYTKDIVYLEGNIDIWNLLTEKPQVFESLFLGKFNPMITRHVKSLQTLEILKEW